MATNRILRNGEETIGFPLFFDVQEPPRGSQLGQLAPILVQLEPKGAKVGDFDVVLTGVTFGHPHQILGILSFLVGVCETLYKKCIK